MSVDQDLAPGSEPLRDQPVATLVMRARNGDQLAWDALVERYAPLIWSLCRRYRLDAADTADVSQNVWLQLVNHLGKIRDPAALPGWLATTTRRECQRAEQGTGSARRTACAGRRQHPGRPGQHRRARAGSRAARGATRGVHAPAAP